MKKRFITIASALVLLLSTGIVFAQERCNLGVEVPSRIEAPGVILVAFTEVECFGIYEDGALAYRDGRKLFGYASTGMPGHRTPLSDPLKGPQKINRIARLHKSKEFEVVRKGRAYPAYMAYSQFFDEKGRAVHEGSVGKRYASHGCIRIPEAAARAFFYGFMDRKRSVIVTRNVAEFREIWERGYFSEKSAPPLTASSAEALPWLIPAPAKAGTEWHEEPP